MRAYIVRRLLLMIPTAFLISVIVFLLMRLVPGDVIDVMIAQMAESAEEIELDREQLERKLGLDASLLVQYARFLGIAPQVDGNVSGVLQGDFGVSWRQRLSVTELLFKKMPVTVELGLMGLVIAQLIAIPIGVYSALRQDTWGDYVGRSFAILSISVPGFWLATLVIVYPSIWWGYMPSIWLIKFADDPMGNLKMFIVPAIVLALAMAGGTMRMTRTMTLEVIRNDYIRTAWAKGLAEALVVSRHALKNAFIPVITIVGLQIPILIGGTVIIEQIFMLPGMGRLIVESLLVRDYPVVSGIMLFFSFGLMLINLLVDLTYGFLDPRVRTS